MPLALIAILSGLFWLAPAGSVRNAVSVGEVEVDPPTFHCLGVALPILGGDDNYNAVVRLAYRRPGETWNEGLPLLRVRPDTVSKSDGRRYFDVGAQFAGSIFSLQPDTPYEVRLEVDDPDGGSTSRTVSLRTRALPPDHPQNPRPVRVSNLQELDAALSAAQPGDVITMANGRYAGALRIQRSGTKENPIFVRGESRDGVVLDSAGEEDGVLLYAGPSATLSNVTLENLTVGGAKVGVRILGADNVVVRGLRITDVSSGIDATGYVEEDNRIYTSENLVICDNRLEGKEVAWPRFDQAVWNYEGIVIEGSGHIVCYNTLSGFGDSLGFEICYGGIRPDSYCELPPEKERVAYSVRNRSVDFYGNDVLWGGDDGIEMDFAERNVRAFENRISNTSMGISLQPVWGGPAYVFRNVIYNTANRPYKLNNDPSGFFILHNTSIRPGAAMNQWSGIMSNFRFCNNITVGSGAGGQTVEIATVVQIGSFYSEIDHNGWYPDGRFRIRDSRRDGSWPDFSSLRKNSGYEKNGVLLAQPVFNALERSLPDIVAGNPLPRPPEDITPHARSGAIDKGIRLPNINDGYQGRAPDLGALERGEAMPHYGVRSAGARR